MHAAVRGPMGAMGAILLLAGCGDDGSQQPSDGTVGGTVGGTAGSSTGGSTTIEPDPTVQPTTGEPSPTTSTTADPLDTGTTQDPGTTGSTGSTGPDSSEGSSESTGDAAPTVQSTTPAELQSGVPADTTVQVEFSEPMDPATITTNVGDEGCTGSVQLSADGFATCVSMMAPPSSGDDQVFTVTPAAPLASATPYQIRVLASVTDAGGTPMAADFTTGTGFFVRYFHTIIIDGIDDFTAGESFASSTPGHTGYVAWDQTFVYLGMDSPDLAADSDQVWIVSYLGGPMGTTMGVTYNTQAPLLPFDARWHVRWRADDTFGGALEWTGASWPDAPFGLDPDDVAFAGSFVELRVAWADLGSPAYLDLHLGILREEPFNEASWAAVPSGSYVDGYDPDYAQFFQFDPTGSTMPAAYMPL